MATRRFTAADQRARDNVFVAAIDLHRAFIGAAARPLKHNLSALVRDFGGGLAPSSHPLLGDLWTSLFLVVPLMSTAFASVERMQVHLPPGVTRLAPRGRGWAGGASGGRGAP